MSEMSEKARSQAKAKVNRLTSTDPHQKVDASSWTPPEPMNAEVKTGMRPISRNKYKSGGKVHGEASKMHAGRKPRKSGGSAMTADSYMNRDMKEANQERDGIKHDGGMKKGGRAKKMAGGPMMGRPHPGMQPRVGNAAPRPGMRPIMRAAGGKVHEKECKCAKCMGGAVKKAAGGPISYGGSRPEGGRIARAKGGRAKKGTNINIIIAPGGGAAKPAMPMPPPGMPPGGPVGLHQGAPPPMPPPGASAPMGPPPMGRKSGGRAYPIDSGAGGGLGRLEKARAYG